MQTGLQPRHCIQQFPAVGMLRPIEEFRSTGFNQYPGTHDGNPIRHFRDRAEIVRDQPQGHAGLLPQATQQLQNLRLQGHIQRGCGFVGDQELRFTGQGQRNHGSLAHSAGKLVRVLVQMAGRIRQTDLIEQLHCLSPQRRSLEPAMQHQGLADLPAYGQYRIERGHRILENNADLAAAYRAHVPFSEAEDIGSIEAYPPALKLPVLRQQAHHRQRRNGFTRPGFTDQGKTPALRNFK